MIKIKEGAKLYKWAIDLLENATDNLPLHAVVIPLCLVTGRRITELISMRSSFTYADTYAANFRGQLKKKDGDDYTVRPKM